jgi:hypothetical protein
VGPGARGRVSYPPRFRPTDPGPLNPRRLLPLGLLALCTAASSAESYGPYLDCAASRAHYAMLLRDAKYPDAADQRRVEENVHAYLRIAVSLAGRELHEEFRAAANRVQAAEEAIMKNDGAEAYLAHAERRGRDCAARVDAHKVELLEAMQRYDAGRAAR